MSTQNPVVIITGANNGIGFHMAAALLEERYRVAGFDLSGEDLAALQETYPDHLLFCRCDVTDEAQVEAAVEAIVEKWDRIDVLPQMKTQGGGIIHNVSSGVGITGFPGIYGYASTKGAIEALTRTLALELARYGVSVNLMHPPLTDTKSASPLGIPSQAMADPADVGRRLAKKILSTKPVITPNFQTTAYLFLARRYPGAVGKLFSKMAEREKNTYRR